MAEITILRTNDILETKHVMRVLALGDIDNIEYSKNILWLVRDKKKAIGMCSLKPLPDEGSVFFSYSVIDPKYRGRGIQRKLIRARLAWAKRHGYTCASTYTLKDNYPSMSNLIKCGFMFYDPHSEYTKNWFYFKKNI